MKILLIQDYLRSGGTERQTVLLARAFAEANHPTTLLTFRPGGKLAASVPTTVSRRILQSFDTHLDWFAPDLPSTVAELAPEIVLCMGRMANCYAGSLQRRIPAAAVINTMRTGKPLPWLFRRSLQHTRQVVANSHDAAAKLADVYAVPREKISVIHNSLVFPSLNPLDVAARAHTRTTHRADAGTLILLNVAMFRPEKNQAGLIKIAASLPKALDWQLWLTGEGPAKDACENLVSRLGLGDRVKFLGWREDPSPLYAAADIAVHASHAESLSNFLIEAQACGLPAVAFKAQGIEECFVSGDTGFAIEPGNKSAFCAALLTLAANSPAERQAQSERARHYARETFDPQRQVAAYLDLFQKLLSAPRPT